MQRLTDGLRHLMHDPRRHPLLSPASLLEALAAVYGGAVALRAALYRGGWLRRRRLPCRVVAMGNLTTGGTGKTPLAMDIAQRISRRGWRVCVLSRGYRGRGERRGAVVSDGRRQLVPPVVAGDEPYLMAGRLPGVPVLVGRDRYAAGMTAVTGFGCQVAVLDDGFQHLALVRDLDLLLVDAQRPLGNGFLLPRGTLREAPGAAARCHAVVRIHRGPGPCNALPAAGAGRPVLGARLQSRPAFLITGDGKRREADLAAAFLSGRRGVAFAGVADNERFFDRLGAFGLEPVRTLGFADHHRYTPADLARIQAAARAAGAAVLVTTAKDQARLAGVGRWDPPLVVFDLDVVWEDGGLGIESLIDRLEPAPQA